MTVFPLVEHYRAELRAQPRARLGAAELADQESDDRGAVQSLAIEGLLMAPLKSRPCSPCCTRSALPPSWP